jgi:MFS family permease
VNAELPAERASAEDAFQLEVRQNLRRNYLAHLVHGLLGQTGFRLINAPTLVPSYVFLLSGSNIAVGAARALQSLGMFLSPILGATLIEHRRRVLPVGFLVGALMRVQLLGLALAGFFLSEELALRSVWLFLGLFGFFLGMQGVIFNFLLSKVIPVDRRGRLLGLRNALAGLTAGAVGALGGFLIDHDFLGNGYASTFLLAFLLTSLGLVMLGFMREPATPTVREPARVRERLGQLPSLLRSDPAFTRYFLARALATMGRMSVPFYVVYGGAKLGLSQGEMVGVLTPPFVVSQSVVNLLWGAIADRRGFRVVFVASLLLWILSALLLMMTNTLVDLVVVMIGLGAGLGGFMMSAQNLVLEFGSRENLPMRIAVANSASELVGAIGPLLGGILATAVSYVAVFWTAIICQLAALLMVLYFVDEPRHRARRATGRG